MRAMTDGDAGASPTVVPVRPSRLPLVAALAVLFAAGCGGSDDATGDITGVSRSTVPVVDTAADPITSTAGTMGEEMGGTAAGGFCGLVTTDDLGELFPDTIPGELTSDEGPMCTWPVGDGELRWLVETGSYTSLRSAATGSVDELDGIGDRAFFDGTSVVTEAGDTVYAVRYTPGTDGTDDGAVVQDVLTRVATRLTTAVFG